tara:strand:+ start:8031 stop:8300 length:270 start_codon:yes stop_codon:yes gene_type:complete
MKLILYPLLVVTGLYVLFFLPTDFVRGSLALGGDGARGVCHLGATNCGAYWRSVLSFSAISYVATLAMTLIVLKVAASKRVKRPEEGDN